jgi:hypothetical protein
MKPFLPVLSASILILLVTVSCGMNAEEREEYLEQSVTVRTARLSARGDSGMLPWVRAEARGGLELTALRVRLFSDANGDGQYQEEEFSGIARVREAQGSGAVLLTISTLTFPMKLERPFLFCEVDTEEGMHTQVLALH